MKKLLLSAIAAFGLFSATAATPTLNWAYLFDGPQGEYTYSFTKTGDGNFVSLNSFGTKTDSESVSYAGDVIATGPATSLNSQNNGIALIKHDADGKKVWAVYSKEGDFDASNASVVATADGGVVVLIKARDTEDTEYKTPVIVDASNSEIEFPEFPSNARTYGAVLFKVSAEGNVAWTQLYTLDELPVPDATANYATSTTNAVFTYALTTDTDGNLYIGGNFRTPFAINGPKNSHYILQPRNLKEYTGDVQSAAGGLFLVKLNADGEYLNHVKVSGDITRDQINGFAYDNGYVYFYGTVKGAENAVVTVGGKSITLSSNLESLLYGRIAVSDFSVDYLGYIKPFASSKGSNTVQAKNIRVIGDKLYFMGHLVGGFGAADDSEARIASTGTTQEGYVIELNAANGAWVSGVDNGTNIGGYYDVFKVGDDIYAYGYRLNAQTGIFIDKYVDNSKWENVERTSLLLGGSAPTTASNVIYDSEKGNLIVSGRGNKDFTYGGNNIAATPSSWGSVIASFNLKGESSSAADVVAEAASYSSDKNSVIVKATEETQVTIYNAAGVQVASQKVAAGTTHIALPQGIYLVNNTKLIVG